MPRLAMMGTNGAFPLKRICICTLLSLFPLAAWAQIDSIFWFAPPDVSAQHEQNPVTFRITAGDDPVTVTLDMPANRAFAPVTFSLAAGATRELTYQDVSIFETRPGQLFQRTGVRIQGNALFTAVYEVGQLFNIDTFVLKGRNALGREFIIPGQNVWEVQEQALSDAFRTVDIVATENNTLISIIPTADVDGVEAGDTLRLLLNRGETYSVRSLSGSPENTLAGTEVTSNKSIAVSIKDDSIFLNGCFDLTGDQIVPVGILGQEYILGPGPLGDTEYAFLTAAFDSTEVFLNNNTEPTQRLNRGEIYALPLTQLWYIETTQPVALMHYTGIGCEIGAALVPSINCKGSVSVPFVRSSSEEFYLSILVQAPGIGGFSFNGVATEINASNFTAIPGTNGAWYQAFLSFDEGRIPPNRAITLINEEYSFQLGVIDGGPGTGTRYGYYSNFSSLYIGDDLTLCPGESRTLSARADPSSTYLWSDGSTGPTLEVSEPGTYWLQATNAFGCVLTDTLEVFASEAEFLNLPDSAEWCEGTPLELRTNQGYFIYNWNRGQGTRREFIVEEAGVVSLTVTNAAGCSDTDSIVVTSRRPPVLDLGNDTTVCPGDPIFLDADVGEPATYSWMNGNTNSGIEVRTPTTYSVTVEVENCILQDTVVFDHYPSPLRSPITGTPVVCPGAEGIEYSVVDTLGSHFTWEIEGGVVSGIGGQAGNRHVVVDWGSTNAAALVRVTEETPDGCTSSPQEFAVRVNVELAPALPAGLDSLCLADSSVTYSTFATNGSAYTWHLPAGGTILSGQGTAEIAVRWDEEGTWPIWVDEMNTTQDTACAGSSDTLWVDVYTDPAFVSLTQLTRRSPDSGILQLSVEADSFQAGSRLRVYRRPWEGEWEQITRLFPTTSTTSDVPNFALSDIYEYQIRSTNACAEALNTEIHANVHLRIDTLGTTATLSWNPYTGWPDGVEAYRVYRKLDRDSSYALWETVAGNTTQLSYTDTRASFVHRFYVEAWSQGGTYRSVSNLDSVRFANPISVPTIFTPNGDSINDRYTLGNIHLYQPNSLRVYNRYGDSVYEADDYTNQWDGGNLPDGVYFLIFESSFLAEPVRTTVTIYR